jgi:hypothetical protein
MSSLDSSSARALIQFFSLPISPNNYRSHTSGLGFTGVRLPIAPDVVDAHRLSR